MITTIENHEGKQFKIETFFLKTFKGRGGWIIECEVCFESNKNTFTKYTTDSEFIDMLSDMIADNATSDEIQQVYFDKYFDGLKEIVLEWCEECVNQGC